MSIKQAEAYIQNIVSESLRDTGYNSIRERLNTSNTQVLDISYSTFKINNDLSNYKLNLTDLNYYYRLFIVIIKSKLGVNKRFSSLTEAGDALTESQLSKTGCILIHSGDTATLIGYTYRDIRDLLTTVANSPQLASTPFGVSTKINVDPTTGEILSSSTKKYSILELGHTGEQTPFAEKIKLVIENSRDTTLTNSLKSILTELVSVQADLGYTYINTSNNDKLGSGIIKLSIQPRSINARFSKEESKLYNRVLNAIQYSLKIENIPGSNTLLEDGIQFGIDKIVGTLSGIKQANVKTHSPIVGKIKIPSTKPKVTTTPYTAPINIPKSKVPAVSYSLASLQLLINSHLQDVISANMGSGNSKNILNYRTGRFAASAKVERMSQSREGMITAFYSYMKNPYQTFEPGYAQGSPKTRDPKLLIAGSIREIAASKVSDRMRAVSL